MLDTISHPKDENMTRYRSKVCGKVECNGLPVSRLSDLHLANIKNAERRSAGWAGCLPVHPRVGFTRATVSDEDSRHAGCAPRNILVTRQANQSGGQLQFLHGSRIRCTRSSSSSPGGGTVPSHPLTSFTFGVCTEQPRQIASSCERNEMRNTYS